MVKQRKIKCVLLIQIYPTAYGLEMPSLDTLWCFETYLFFPIYMGFLCPVSLSHHWHQKQEVTKIRGYKDHKCHNLNISLPERHQIPLPVSHAIRKTLILVKETIAVF